MKIKELGVLARREQSVCVLDTPGGQWVNIGGGMYPLNGLPELDEHSVLALLDVPEEDRSSYASGRMKAPAMMLRMIVDNHPEDRDASLCDLTVSFRGVSVQPVATTSGMVFVDPAMLKPVQDRKNLTMHRRNTTQTGTCVIAVKEGMQLLALLPVAEVWATQERADLLWAVGNRVNEIVHEKKQQADGEQMVL